MDTYREHPTDFEPGQSASAPEPERVQPDIGSDERRMQVRAYNYWASLLDGRDYPSIEDLEPGDLKDFAPHSVLLDFTSGQDNPATPYIGDAVREECGLGDQIQTIADVPSRSLLSRLTDHYMQIIANRAPVGFEAEFENQRSETICYRGILMPFSSDGDTIDFIYGVINWKKGDAGHPATTTIEALPALDAETFDQVPFQPETAEEAEEAFPIHGLGEAEPEDELVLEQVVASADAPVIASADEQDDAALTIEIGDDAGLGDRLWAARESAEAAKASEGRSRTALYLALSHAYDLAIASKDDPEGYSELLEESGVKPQARAPMTAIVKLVFGIDYDKSRLTEFATALCYADRNEVAQGGFLALVEAQVGGLKALVAAERQARRPEPKTDTLAEAARARLRSASPVALDSIDSGEEFALVLTRRSDAGVHEAVALVDDPALVERAIRRAGA